MMAIKGLFGCLFLVTNMETELTFKMGQYGSVQFLFRIFVAVDFTALSIYYYFSFCLTHFLLWS